MSGKSLETGVDLLTGSGGFLFLDTEAVPEAWQEQLYYLLELINRFVDILCLKALNPFV